MKLSFLYRCCRARRRRSWSAAADSRQRSPTGLWGINCKVASHERCDARHIITGGITGATGTGITIGERSV